MLPPRFPVHIEQQVLASMRQGLLSYHTFALQRGQASRPPAPNFAAIAQAVANFAADEMHRVADEARNPSAGILQAFRTFEAAGFAPQDIPVMRLDAKTPRQHQPKIKASPEPAPAILKRWVSENLERYFAAVEPHRRRVAAMLIERDRAQGGLTFEQYDLLADSLNTTIERVLFIAKDQVEKLDSRIGASVLLAEGFDRFTWWSMEDNKVRPIHEAAHGNVYWTDLGHPTEGRPGEPPNCRCRMVPYTGPIFPPR